MSNWKLNFLNNNIICNSIRKLGITLTKKKKKLERLYTKTQKALLREVKEDLNKWRCVMFMHWTSQYC